MSEREDCEAMRKEIHRVTKSVEDLGFGTPTDAVDNLLGAICDLEEGRENEVTHRTLRRVHRQLHNFRAALTSNLEGR